MKVKKVMNESVIVCNPGDVLKDAIDVMRENDCGAVPVVDGELKPVGFVTDRDIALALGTSGLNASEMKISALLSRSVITCKRTENIERALKKMKQNKVRRLPVVDEKGAVAGILSICDLLNMRKMKGKLRKRILLTLTAICKADPIVLREVAG